MLAGVVAGMAAGALWGLVFVSSLAVEPFTPYDLTVARYIVFAAVCLPLGFVARRRGRIPVDAAIVRSAVLLGAVGFTLYFVLAAIAVRLAGVSVVALIIGALPLVIAIGGNRRRVSLAALAPSLMLVAAGLLAVNGAALMELLAGRGIPGLVTDPTRFAFGVALAIAANACWALYAFENDAALRQRPDMQALDWTAVQGIGALAGLFPLLLAGPLLNWTRIDLLGWNAETGRFLAWAVALGVFSSVVATWLWSIASRRLSVAMAGLLIASETLFGVAFGLVHDARWPAAGEIAGTLMLVAGVVLGLRVFARARNVAVT